MAIHKPLHGYLRIYIFWSIVGAILFSFESWAFGPLSWIYGYGSGLETIPTYLALAMDDRNFSTWSPFIAGGLDRLAFWGNANPVGIEQGLFSILPVWLANGIDRFLQYFIAILFTSLVLEQQFSLGRRFNLLAGWLMACFSYLTVGALFTISGVPILAWLLYILVKPGSKWYLAILSAVAFSFCTTFSFGVPYFLVFAFGWLLIVMGSRSWHVFWQFLLFSVSLILTTIPQLLAIVANVGFSHRTNWPGEQVNFSSVDGFLYRQLQFDLFAQDHILSIITLNLPNIGMLIGVCFAFFAMRDLKLRSKAKVFLRIFVLYAILSQKWLWILVQTTVGKVLPWAMGIYMGRFYQIPAAFLIAIGLTFTCYFIWHLLLVNRNFRLIGVSTVSMFVAFMILWPKWHLLYSLGIHDWGEKNYQIAALEDIKRIEKEPFRVASVLPLQPAYAYAQGLETADGWANLFPALYRDLWLQVNKPLLMNLPYVKNVIDPDNGKPQDNYIFLGLALTQPGIGLLPNEDLSQSMTEGFDLEHRFNINLISMLNVKYLLSEYPLKSPEITLIHSPEQWPICPQSRCYATGLITERRLQCASMQTNLRKSFAQSITDYATASRRKSNGKDIFVYALKKTIPRFRLVKNVVVEQNNQSVLERLASFDSATHMHTAVIEADVAQELSYMTNFTQGDVHIKSYNSSSLELEVSPNDTQLLVIANTWNPNWKAEVDGLPRKLIRVNHAQFGLILFKGDKKITMYYAPPYLAKLA